MLAANFGLLRVTSTEVLIGTHRYPLKGTTWTVEDHTMVVSRPSTAAVVMCLSLVWACGLGLLFLLLREDRVVGTVQVTVSGPQVTYAVHIPIRQGEQAPVRAAGRIADIRRRVATVQALADAA